MNVRCFLAGFAVCFQTIFAGGPPQEPRLRVEADMHTATVDRVSTDASGRLALTVSVDKSARLWELASGTLLRVLRPPLDTDDEGKLYCGALSPDGTLAAVGGWTGYAWDRSGSIYLFATASGRLVHRFVGLPQVILDLVFSPDGRRLAAALGGANGIRLFDASGPLLGEDLDYGGDSYSVSFSPEGHRLVSSCLDGLLRLYAVDSTAPRMRALRLLAKEPAFGGQAPYSVRFSPDGERLAVGFHASATVGVFRATDLAFLFAPDTRPGSTGNLLCGDWSSDGRTLFAGGMGQDRAGLTLIWRWSAGGHGAPVDTPVSLNTVMDLRPLPNGGLLFGTSDPSWGILDATGKRIRWQQMPTADFRNAGNRFMLSADSDMVSFAFRALGKRPALFMLAARQLVMLPDSKTLSLIDDLRPPRLDGLPIDRWEGNYTPKLGGKPLALKQGERAISLAIAPNRSFLVLGTEWALRCFAANGKPRWSQRTPSFVCALNVSYDGQFVVAGYGDGTLRWHRADTGQELLAFFPHADERRWVVWTPQGYYDCSPGGEDLIGWHLNRGKDQTADFFPASRFRAVYYRPDVIQRILKTLDTTKVLRQANSALRRTETDFQSMRTVIARLSPPVVELVSGGVFREVTVSRNAPSVIVRYSVRQTGRESPTKISVRLNGRPVEVAAPLPPEGKEAEVEVPLLDSVAGEISIIAEHELGASEAAILRVRREGGSVPARKPNLYVIACGVAHLQASELSQADGTVVSVRKQGIREESEHRLRFQDLLFAADDARKFVGLFSAQKEKVYAQVIPTVLVDKQATTAAITDALNDVNGKAQPGDVVIFFFSGHGHFIPDPGFLLITHDTNPQNLAGTALTGRELARRLAKIRGSVVLALDTCYSGAALEGDKQVHAVTGPDDLTGLVNQLSSSEQGVVVLSSSAENQSSWEDPVEGGVFTRAIAEGLAGGAVQNGAITCNSLQKWIIERVPVLARKADPKAEQYPACIMPKGVPDFTLAMP